MSDALTPVAQAEVEAYESDTSEASDVHERPATQLSVLPTPVPADTGVPAVDEALARLADLADLDSDPEQHVAVLEDVHDRLQSALTGPDSNAL